MGYPGILNGILVSLEIDNSMKLVQNKNTKKSILPIFLILSGKETSNCAIDHILIKRSLLFELHIPRRSYNV